MIPDGPSEEMESSSKNTIDEDAHDNVREGITHITKPTEEPKVNGESEKSSPADAPLSQEVQDIIEKESSAPVPAQVKITDDEPLYSSEDEEKLVINMSTERRLEEHFSLDLTKKDKSQKRKCEDEGNERKKLKVVNELKEISDDCQADYSQAQLDENIFQLRKQLTVTQELLFHKEEEWDALLRQQKKQELELCRLLRRRKLLQRKLGVPDNTEYSGEENDTRSPPSLKDDQAFSLKSFLLKNDNRRLIPRSPTSEPSISVIDISTNAAKILTERPQVAISPETQIKISRQMSTMKPILPKPFCSSGVSIVNNRSSSPLMSYSQTGFGPQGPTVSVDQIIAAHRKDHPSLPPIRGAKRGAWRHRYDGDKYIPQRDSDRPSSVSSSHGDSDRSQYSKTYGGPSGLPMDPNVSFKDVLIQFAQLTQNEKHSSSPQVSIIPVSNEQPVHKKPEPSPDSTSVAHSAGNSLEGSSALAKLLLESRVSGPGGMGTRPSSVDASAAPAPQYLTLSSLLSGTSSTSIKDKGAPLQLEPRSKKDDLPSSFQKCQGCHQSKAQFVCAGCGNQWYCSRDCQVSAWEDHSEQCNN